MGDGGSFLCVAPGAGRGAGALLRPRVRSEKPECAQPLPRLPHDSGNQTTCNWALDPRHAHKHLEVRTLYS